MAMSFTRIIARPKGLPRIERTVADEFTAHKARLAKARRKLNVETYVSDTPTSCTKCPATRSCATCAAINESRIQMGLLVPKGDHTPHRWACLIPVTHGKIGGGLNGRTRRKTYPVITACVKRKGGGWWQGVASLDGNTVFVTHASRCQATAWEHAQARAADIREGLNYLSSVGA